MNRTFKIAVISFLLCLAVALAPELPIKAEAQDPAEPLPVAVEKIFAQWNRTDCPGCVIAVAREGKTIYARGFGMANLEHSIPMTPATVSESGSVAKQFTAAAVVLLAQRGKLSLDDPVIKYLPEFPRFSQYPTPITIRMLINHTSGLRDMHGLFDLLGRPSYSSMHVNDEVLEVIGRQQDLNFAPGTEYLYSNSGYALLTIIVERVSGTRFAEFCRENIFRPLGMNQTEWRDDFARIIKGRAAGYEPSFYNGIAAFRISLPYSNIYGNGGLLTTVGDLMVWNESFDSGSPEWMEVARQLQAPSKLNDGTSISYALGLTVGNYKGIKEVSHGGATSGYRTYLARYPEKRLSIALLCNTAGANTQNLVRRVADAVLGLSDNSPKPAPVELSPKEIEAWAGLYRNVKLDSLIRLEVRGGKLFDGGSQLIPTGKAVFSSTNSNVEYSFALGGDGKTRSVKVGSGENAYTFTSIGPANPTEAQLLELAGNYHSAELDITHPVTVRNGRLAIRIRPSPPVTGTPTFADGFLFPSLGHIAFYRNSEGKVAGFELTNVGGRCRRVKFRKLSGN